MTNEEKDKLEYELELHEGNLFAVLQPYAKVRDIKDKEFQQLRIDYLEARFALLKYIDYN